MKAKFSDRLQWITLPPQFTHQPKRMKNKELIIFSLMILTSCAAVFLLSPRILTKDGKPPGPPPGAASQAPALPASTLVE